MPKKIEPRRRYEEDFKRHVVAEAGAADVSVSEIARRHGLNANLVFNWRKKFGGHCAPPQRKLAAPECQLVAVEVQPDHPPRSADVALSQSADPDRGPIVHSPMADHAAANQSASGILEIALPCGSRVRCSSGVEPALLGEALAALRPVQTGGTE